MLINRSTLSDGSSVFPAVRQSTKIHFARILLLVAHDTVAADVGLRLTRTRTCTHKPPFKETFAVHQRKLCGVLPFKGTKPSGNAPLNCQVQLYLSYPSEQEWFELYDAPLQFTTHRVTMFNRHVLRIGESGCRCHTRSCSEETDIAKHPPPAEYNLPDDEIGIIDGTDLILEAIAHLKPQRQATGRLTSPAPYARKIAQAEANDATGAPTRTVMRNRSNPTTSATYRFPRQASRACP